MRFMREDDERLIAVGDELAGLLVEQGLTADGSVLDVGSGYGRLALGILHSLDFRGRYLGFDILPRHVAWCAQTITPAFPTMRFAHLDIRNERYNPAGMLDPATVGFPAPSARTGFCALFSVFTHLHRPVVERYLHEIHRVLEPGGTAVTTWFLFDAARLPTITSSAATYPMVHVLDEVSRYADADDPLQAIAYDEAAVRGWAAAARLEVVSIDHGTWAGEPGRTFQDLVILQRTTDDLAVEPMPPGPPLGTRARAAARHGRTRLGGAWRRLRRGVGRRVRAVTGRRAG